MREIHCAILHSLSADLRKLSQKLIVFPTSWFDDFGIVNHEAEIVNEFHGSRHGNVYKWTLGRLEIVPCRPPRPALDP